MDVVEGQRLEGAVFAETTLFDARLTPTALRYYGVVMREPELDLDEIAQRMQTSPKTTRRARATLLNAGWMEIVTTQGPRGSRTEHRCLVIPARRAS